MHGAPSLKGKGLDCLDCEHRTLRMFCNLNDAALRAFASIGTEISLPKASLLFQEHDRTSSVFVLCTGQVKLFCTSKEGKTLILRIAMPGDVLGLSAVLSGSPYEVSAETLGQVELRAIPRLAFIAFLESYGEGSLHAAKAMADDYKAAFFDARRLALSRTAGGRLASLLLEWGKAATSGEALQMRFTMALTHEELANMLGTSRETITRMLSKFKKENLIRVRGSSISILAPAILEELAG